jgi:carbamoyl-phosphate synthase small subunit
MTASPDAILVLEDGTTLRGKGFGAGGETFGEMVFNTGMTGYQETLTDPSYCGQIVAMTAPHIGNTGVNDEDPESHRIWVSGYVVREPSRLASSWRARRTLDAELKAQDVTGIAVPGTRALTMRIREHGAMRAAISAIEDDPARLLDRVLASPGMTGADLARIVTTPHPYTVSPPPGTPVRYRVAAVDLGIKASTPRHMAARGMEIRVLPATVTAREILAASPDGVFFSNGPGDPAAAGYAVAAMRGVLEAGVPVFGICFGSQILSLAIGLTTYKLRYGHRGVNQPVLDLATGRVYITSHNHGFAAALPQGGMGGREAPPSAGAGEEWRGGQPLHAGGLRGLGPRELAPEEAGGAQWAHIPASARNPFGTPFGEAVVSHVNLNDGVVEGIRLLDHPAFSVQYHPEAAPGPHDAVDLFDRFATLMDSSR